MWEKFISGLRKFFSDRKEVRIIAQDETPRDLRPDYDVVAEYEKYRATRHHQVRDRF